MELMIFDRYRVLHDQLDDGEGNEVSLEDHVEYEHTEPSESCESQGCFSLDDNDDIW